jgi:glycosyltransferase involved in cell wall biosynthesis
MELTSRRPKVSICVVTYNQENYIRECLQSIVDQETDFEFELLIGDDCSTDRTAEIVNEFEARYPSMVRKIRREVNLGALQNFVQTHNEARGSYVAHIDGDDIMLKGKLQLQANFLEANSDFSVVWHKVNLFDDCGGFFPGEKYNYSFFPDGVVTLSHALRLGSVGAHSSCMYRRSARKTRKADMPTIDLFFTWEYLLSGKGKILDQVLGAYRVSAQGSILQTLNMRKINADHARHYLMLLPEQRRNIFIFGLMNFLIDLKNRRGTSLEFARLIRDSACFVSPLLIIKSLREIRHLVSHPLRYGEE